MKQIVQNYKTGEIVVEEVSPPLRRAGGVLVRNVASAVSLGTERSVIEFGKKSLIAKALARPELVRQAVSKAGREGLWKTFQEAMGRLDTPNPLGYSCAGVVEEVGTGVDGFNVGDRVACIGAGFASHAELVSVPLNLCALIPAGVADEEAAFGMLGIIAMHAVRTSGATLGETIAVVGLGLLGQIVVQLLKACGCRVVACDLDTQKIALASHLGCDLTLPANEWVQAGISFSRGLGVDACIIAASTDSSQPIEDAAEVCRPGGRIVLMGVCDIQIPRQIFWEKELGFKVSKAGGAGIFDPIYELQGIDYPVGLARWTQGRNLETFLDLLRQKKLRMEPLITHRLEIQNAQQAYEMLLKGQERPMGVLLRYPAARNRVSVNGGKPAVQSRGATKRTDIVGVGVVGAGLFAKALMLPALSKQRDISLRGIAAATGPSARHMQRKLGFAYDTTDYRGLLADDSIDAILVLTRHDLHARLAVEVLAAGKHLFVEKPLCLREDELAEIESAYKAAGRVLMVGFNRRYAPLSLRIKKFFQNRSTPLVVQCRINAGAVPRDHWVHDPVQGGGRILGEVCHFVDLIQYWTGALIQQVYAQRISTAAQAVAHSDNVSVTLKMQDGSLGQILYTASGDKGFSRERYELFCEGSVGVIDDFRQASFVRSNARKEERRSRQDMGYQGELETFFDAIRKGEPSPVPFHTYANSTAATLKAVQSIERGCPLEISLPEAG